MRLSLTEFIRMNFHETDQMKTDYSAQPCGQMEKRNVWLSDSHKKNNATFRSNNINIYI